MNFPHISNKYLPSFPNLLARSIKELNLCSRFIFYSQFSLKTTNNSQKGKKPGGILLSICKLYKNIFVHIHFILIEIVIDTWLLSSFIMLDQSSVCRKIWWASIKRVVWFYLSILHLHEKQISGKWLNFSFLSCGCLI